MTCPNCGFPGPGEHLCLPSIFGQMFERATGAQYKAAPQTDPKLAAFCPEITVDERKRFPREAALLEGRGTIQHQTNCAPGTPGYALLYLEWEGLMYRRNVDTGPLPHEAEARFWLTKSGEKARDELLAVRVVR